MTEAHRHNRGFTLTELLVVIAVICFLTSISFVVFANAISLSREKATRATILKLHGLIQQRVEAMNRSLDRLNLQPAVSKMQKDLKNLGLAVAPTQRTCEILTRKQIFQLRFPQNFSERDPNTLDLTYDSSKHRQETESAALLFWLLTKSDVFGVAPVDQSDFSTAEIRDTDGDGLIEFIDAWGQPLRFYRWPTQLFRSGAGSTPPGVAAAASPSTLTNVDRTYDSVLWSGLPAPPSVPGAIDPLTRDPDDPTGELLRFVKNSGNMAAVVMTTLQNRFHTPNTYHAFLIVSPGPDNNLGIGEPYDYGTGSNGAPDTTSYSMTTTNPALGTVGQGRLASLSTYVSLEQHPIIDNLTNRQR